MSTSGMHRRPFEGRHQVSDLKWASGNLNHSYVQKYDSISKIAE